MSGPTPLFIVSKQIVDDLDRVVSEKLMKWRMFSARWTLNVENYYGKQIQYSGIRFEGLPQEVFWKGFIEPFLENGIVKSLEKLDNICKTKNLDSTEHIKEIRGLLISLIRKTYKNMSRTDQILRGNGFPDSVAPVNVSANIKVMEKFLDEYIIAFTHKGKRKEEAEEVFELKPRIYGVGVNIKALWHKIKKKIGI